MDLKTCLRKVIFGMQSNNIKDIAKIMSKSLRSFFKDKVKDFCIYNLTNEPYEAFSINFQAYNYFFILLNYDRGRIGCSIQYGENALIKLKNSQEWYEKANFDIFCKELQEQLELRIPDKFLETNGWK